MKSTPHHFRSQRGGVKGILIGVTVVVLAAGLGYIFVTSSNKNLAVENPVVTVTDTTTGQNTPTDPTVTTPPIAVTPPTPAPTPTPAPKPVVSSSVYKDGTYSTIGSYYAPGGLESISVTVTLKNDVVINSNVVSQSGDRTSIRYQNAFISGYKQYVIGKKINTISLGSVSGSSLTPQGFNTALTQIESKAKA